MGTTPAAVPVAERIPQRPNGVFYPATGVVVGYAHPPNAIGSPVEHGISSGYQCTAQGGTCLQESACSGTTLANLCPGPASVKCCLP